MAYLKPQTPIQLNENYIYPLTTADQVMLGNGNRLNSLFKKTVQETATLQAANWSDTLPYIQTITISESTDDYNVDANIVYSGNKADTELNKAASCLTYVKKSGKNIIFYCLKEKPEIDIPIEITGTCRNTIATVEEGIKLNFDIIGNPRPKTGDTLYWDGNTEGLESFQSQWYKVSSIAPSIEDFSNGYTLLLSNGAELTEKDAPTEEVQANIIGICGTICIVVTEDNVEAMEGVFLSKGVYFPNSNFYASSLTIPGFTGFEKDDIEVKENTIWVDTDVPITGYKFSSTEPEDMVEGEVWICIGTESNVAFDIVDGAKMYPLSVKQYVNSVWVNKTAMSYQNNSWTKWWLGQLFDNGNQWESITGGWTDEGYTFYDTGWANSEGKYEYVDTTISDKIYLATSGSLDISCAGTVKQVDLTKYNTLYIHVDYSTDNNVAVYINKNKRKIDYNCALKQTYIPSGEKAIDISNLEGSYYIYCHILMTEDGHSQHSEISKIWLEE